MPRRYFEMDADSPAETWWRIRALRAAPPTGMPDSRRKLFVTSLEQAEQQFAAAASVGFESRALNLYYGLSQAGRAISAALTPDGAGVSPEVSGHGLHVELSGARSDRILDLSVRAEGGENTSFGRLAWLLGSDSLAGGLHLRDVWNMILEVSLDAPQGSSPLPILVEKPSGAGDTFTLGMTLEEAADDAAAMKARYPDLSPAHLVSHVGNGYHVADDGTRTELARLRYAGFADALPSYRGSPVLMPACGDGRQPLDPVLAWWVMLYALSMLTRYKPAVWTDAMDVNRSPLAVPLEILLSKALEAVPAQVLIALTLVPHPRGGRARSAEATEADES